MISYVHLNEETTYGRMYNVMRMCAVNLLKVHEHQLALRAAILAIRAWSLDDHRDIKQLHDTCFTLLDTWAEECLRLASTGLGPSFFIVMMEAEDASPGVFLLYRNECMRELVNRTQILGEEMQVGRWRVDEERFLRFSFPLDGIAGLLVVDPRQLSESRRHVGPACLQVSSPCDLDGGRKGSSTGQAK